VVLVAIVIIGDMALIHHILMGCGGIVLIVVFLGQAMLRMISASKPMEYKMVSKNLNYN
jgi:hypothetical protein